MSAAVLLAGSPTAGCGGDGGGGAETGSPCGDGEVLDGAGCVPEACGTGPWGDVAVGSGTLFVDAEAGAAGDGSEVAPYGSIDEALDRAAELGDGAHVVLAAGTYPERVRVTRQHADLVVEGRCPALVVLDGSGGEDYQAALSVDAEGDEGLTVRGVTVLGSGYGVEATGGTTRLQGVVISRTRLIGVVLVGGSRVVIEDSVVSTADPDDPGSGGRGAELYGGSVLEVHRSSFVANRAAGILSTGSTVVLADSEVRDTEPSVGLGDGYGIDGREGSVLDLSGSLLDGNASQGLILSDSEATLRGVTVRGTREVVAGRPGRGLQAGPDVTLVLEDVLFEANQGYDFVIGEGEATLEGVEFRDSPQVDRGTEVGGGIGALDGARLTLRSCVFDGKEGYGIYMESAEADLDGVTVRGTDGRLDRGFGTALYLWRGSKASAVDCTFEGNRHSAVAILESEADIEGMVVRDTESAFESAHAIGVSVVDGGRLDLRSSSIEGSRGYGVIVTDGSEAEVEDVVIDGVARSSDPPLGFGLVSQVESVVHADALVVRGTEGPGLFSYGASTLSCDECVIEDASFAGAAVSSSGLYLDRSRIEAASVDSWMGGGVGVYADEAEWFADVVLTRVEVAAQPLAGVYAIAIGEIGGSELALWIEYSTIAGGGDHPPSFWPYGTAIFVSGPVEPWEGAEQAGAYILDNDLVDSSGAALFLDDGASASLRSNSFVGNEVDLVQQRCGPSTPEVDAGDGAATYRGCGESPYAVDLFELDPGLDEDVPLDAGETELMPR